MTENPYAPTHIEAIAKKKKENFFWLSRLMFVFFTSLLGLAGGATFGLPKMHVFEGVLLVVCVITILIVLKGIRISLPHKALIISVVASGSFFCSKYGFEKILLGLEGMPGGSWFARLVVIILLIMIIFFMTVILYYEHKRQKENKA